MSELNKKFPGILVGWLSGNGYIMPPEECNDLTKYVSGLELRLAEAENAVQKSQSQPTSVTEHDNARLINRVDELEKAINDYINVCQSRYSMTEFLDASIRLEIVVGRRKPL